MTAPDLSQLSDDGDTVELENGRTLRLRIQHDEVDPFEQNDCYGKVTSVESGPRNDYGYRDRPDGFDGSAEKLWLPQNCGVVWWQPPTDVKRTDEGFTKLRDLVMDLAAFGSHVITLELLEGVDAYRRPIVTQAAGLGGVDSLDGGYLAEVVSELAAELEL